MELTCPSTRGVSSASSDQTARERRRQCECSRRSCDPRAAARRSTAWTSPDALADEVAIVDRGRVVASGSPEELKASIGTDVVTVRVPVGADEAAKAEQALRKLDGASDIRTVEDSVVVYIKEGSTAIPAIVLRLSDASIPVREVTL